MIGAIIPAMWWRSEPEHVTKAQLIEARDTIVRQIEILQVPSGVRGGPPDNSALIAALQDQLRELNALIDDPEQSSP